MLQNSPWWSLLRICSTYFYRSKYLLIVNYEYTAIASMNIDLVSFLLTFNRCLPSPLIHNVPKRSGTLLKSCSKCWKTCIKELKWFYQEIQRAYLKLEITWKFLLVLGKSWKPWSLPKGYLESLVCIRP